MGNEKDALAGLAFFRSDLAAQGVRAQDAWSSQETTPGNAWVLPNLPVVEGFLGSLKSRGRTTRR